MKYLVLKQMGLDRKTNEEKDKKNTTPSASEHFPSGPAKKSRRFRSAFTTEQINYLEKEFKKFPYIGSGNRKDVSTFLNIPERAVKIWFQNRRMKEKKEVTNKESADEELKKINISRQGQSNVNFFNHQSHSTQSTQPYNVCQSELKTTYSDPSITKAGIKHFSGNKNVYASNKSFNSIQEKNRITVKNFNVQNFTDTNSRIVSKAAPVISRHFKNKNYPRMKMLQNKNICHTKVAQQLPANQNLEHVKVKQENPQDLTSDLTQYVQSKFYQINPNQEQRYMPLHVPTLPQPPPFVPGNILWKPVNMMPLLPGMATPPPQLHNNNFSLIHPNFKKEDCKCNCKTYTSQDMSPLMQIDGRLHLQSQYVLAMPFNHHFDRI